MAEIKPITSDLWAQYHGARPARTTLGYAITEGEKVLALFGLARDMERWILYLDAGPELRARRQSMHVRRLAVEGIRKTRMLIATLRAPVHSQAVTDFPRACEMLERIGMRHCGRGVYIWAR